MAEFGRVRSRAKDLFAELDVEVEKLNKSGELKFTKGASKPAKRPAAAKQPAAKAPAKSKPTPGRTRQETPLSASPAMTKGRSDTRSAIDRKIKETQSKGKSEGSIQEYDSSVTRTTTGPATVRGRRGTQTTKETAGTMRGGKSDNPQMQRASDDMRVKSKYLNIARNADSREAIRAKLVESGSPDLEAFNRAYPQKKSKKK